jgi:hypothetical protein
VVCGGTAGEPQNKCSKIKSATPRMVVLKSFDGDLMVPGMEKVWNHWSRVVPNTNSLNILDNTTPIAHRVVLAMIDRY